MPDARRTLRVWAIGAAAVGLLVVATWPALIGRPGAVVIGALLFGRVAYVLDDIQQRTRRIEQLLRDGHL